MGAQQPRYSSTVAAPPRSGGPPAINPNLILGLRFLLTALVCGLALATAIMAILVVRYYDTHDPIIRPSWGSLIFLIVLGFFTCIIYFGYNILMPIAPFINYGDFLYSLFMVKLELLLQFTFCVLWVSGALAYASDMRGYENCQFDGYLHYPKPDDFHHVCDLTNWVVPLAYATFGMQVLLWFFETAFGLYTFLYLDQESLNEPHFAWGRRAYDYRTGANQSGSAGRGNAYRARAVPAEGESAAAGAATGTGRRGATYNDPERGSEEMAEEPSDRPRSLGARGRRGYDEEDQGNEVTEADRNPNDASNDRWHLREENGAHRV